MNCVCSVRPTSMSFALKGQITPYIFRKLPIAKVMKMITFPKMVIRHSLVSVQNVQRYVTFSPHLYGKVFVIRSIACENKWWIYGVMKKS